MRILQGLTALFVVYALVSRFWAAEDAYITFRVVENLYAGLGLVYNAGERVEAFTHPLWMICLTILRGLDLPLHASSILLGFVMSGFGLVLTMTRKTRASPKVQASGKQVRYVIPFVVLSLAAHSGFRDFAVSGMEFSLAFLLIVVFFHDLEDRPLRSQPFGFGLLLGALYLTRPELGLLIPYYSIFLFAEVYRQAWPRDPAAIYASKNEQDIKSNQLKPPRLYARFFMAFFRVEAFKIYLAWGGAILLTAGSYHLFRYAYYDEFFPNTYYAKSGGSSYTIQGIKYLIHAILYAPAIWPALIVSFIFPLLHNMRHIIPPFVFMNYLRDAGATLLLTFYVVRLGGDFMSFRFLLPETVMVALLAGRWFRYGLAEKIRDAIDSFILGAGKLGASKAFQALYGRGTALAFAGVFFYTAISLIPTPMIRGYIADERQIFVKDMKGGPLQLLFSQDHPWGRAADHYRRLQDCLGHEDFWISNSQYHARCTKGVGLGYFGMRAGPGVKIMDEQGLPDRDIARKPVLLRYRPGHERSADFKDVLRKGAFFCSTGENAYDSIMQTPVGVLIRWEKDVLATVPHIRQRLQKLLVLKRSGSPVIPRLEKRYNILTEDLLRESKNWEKDPYLRSRNRCWKAKTLAR